MTEQYSEEMINSSESPAPEGTNTADTALTCEDTLPPTEETKASEANEANEETEATEETDTSGTNATIEGLRSEIKRLQGLIREREEQHKRLSRELGEFTELFPDRPLREIPEEIWQQVKEGIPLAAAYALMEKRTQLQSQRIEKINQSNASRSPGMAGKATAAEYFTPDEVRAMTRSEVRANYSKIVESMKKWN